MSQKFKDKQGKLTIDFQFWAIELASCSQSDLSPSLHDVIFMLSNYRELQISQLVRRRVRDSVYPIMDSADIFVQFCTC